MTLIKNILLEMGFAGSVSVDDITNAVTHMLSADIIYDDGKGGDGKSKRHICPVAYGLSTAGNPVVRAFQKYGSTKRGVPHWKLFDATKISSWDTIEDEKYNPNELVGFNKDGDKQMEIVYSIAPIGNARQVSRAKNQNLPGGITSTPATKAMVNRDNSKANDEEPVDNRHYTAKNAVNDILKTAKMPNSQTDIDYSKKDDYSSNINPDETKPVTVSDIPGGERNVNPEEKERLDNTQSTAISNEPIKKSDIDGSEPEITKSFKDMMQRMNNLNKDEDELEDKENGN